MGFVSYGFPLLVGGLLLVYYLLPRERRWWALLVGSWGFYALCGLRYVPFLAFVTGSVYLGARGIRALEEKRKGLLAAHPDYTKGEKKALKAAFGRKKRGVFLLALLLNLGLLGGCKYLGLFEALSPGELLPLGLSFYMFQALGYLIDVYRGKYPPEKRFFRFALFVGFFPQLVQGPISRFDGLEKTLFAGGDLRGGAVGRGLLRALWGYFKKMVIADRLSAAVTACFAVTPAAGSATALGMGLYAIRLLCDFTGGMDIALGTAGMFGVLPMENFDAPYLSGSLAEYWTRWHISMGSWFRDYIFYPLSVCKPMLRLNTALRRRFKAGFFTRVPLYGAILATWLATGLWHGAGWNFPLWGLTNGLLLILSQELDPAFARFHSRFPALEKSRGWEIFRIGRTFLLLCCIRLWDCFTAPGPAAEAFLSLFFRPDFAALGTLWPTLSMTGFDWAAVLLGLCPVVWLDIRKKQGKPLMPKSQGAVWALIALLLVLTLTFGVYGSGYRAADFIYGRF